LLLRVQQSTHANYQQLQNLGAIVIHIVFSVSGTKEKIYLGVCREDSPNNILKVKNLSVPAKSKLTQHE
jgi:HD superfamily phosphodiesterase